MYLEIWMSVQDAYAEIPCDLCQKPIGEHLRSVHLVGADLARLIRVPIGIYHPLCQHRLLMAFNPEAFSRREKQ